MSKIRTHYDNLKIARNAPDSLIRAAYKVLLQQHHPDKVEGSKQQDALRITQLIRESYDVLSDPIKRAEHDKWIKEQESGKSNENQYYQKQENHDSTNVPINVENNMGCFWIIGLVVFCLWIFSGNDESPTSEVEQANTYAKYAEQATREIEATAKRLKDNSEKFIDNKDGTVTLKANGWIWQRSNDLMWQRCSIGQNWTGTTCEGDAKKFTWDDAIKLTSNFAGYNDWRLPTNKELRSLIYCSDGMTQTLGKEESGRFCTASPLSPTINTIYFPNTPSDWFWSSTPSANSSSSAWRVYFYNGYSDDNGKDSYGNVQLVR
jgi:curved DNA-binding protein CbpA